MEMVRNYHTKINIIFPTKSQTTKLTKSRDNVRIVEAKRTKSARNFGGAEELNFLAEDDWGFVRKKKTLRDLATVAWAKPQRFQAKIIIES